MTWHSALPFLHRTCACGAQARLVTLDGTHQCLKCWSKPR